MRLQNLKPELNGKAAASREGFARVPNWVIEEHGPKIGAFGLAALLVLQRFAGAKSECWPSLETIAMLSGASRSKTIRVLRMLEAYSLIAVSRSKGIVNRYNLLNAVHQCPTDTGVPQTLHQCPTDTGTSVPQTPEEEHLKKNKKKNTSSGDDDPSFKSFWDAYPKKVAKQQALKSWQKLAPSETLVAAILVGLEAHKKSRDWTKDDGEFIPYPATFLNGRRWEDETSTGNLKTFTPRTRF